MRSAVKINCLLLFGSAVASCVWSQEAYILGGVIKNPKTHLAGSNLERQGDFYILGGQGRASPGGNTQFYLEMGLREHITQNISAGFAYINEGHPDLDVAGHRDGFALMGWYQIPILNNKLRIEAGAGPYLSMNTTWRGNNFEQEYNDKSLGLLAILALVFPISDTGLNLRAQVNEVIMPGSFNTTAVILGLGIELGGKPYAKRFSKDKDGKYAVNVLAGLGQTTRAGEDYDPEFNKIELQIKISDRFAWSVSGISESSSGISHRKGIAIQGWFITPKFGRLGFSVGIGPYIAQERKSDDGTSILGLATMRAKVDIAKGWSGIAEFNRAISTYDKDEDIFLFGIGKEF